MVDRMGYGEISLIARRPHPKSKEDRDVSHRQPRSETTSPRKGQTNQRLEPLLYFYTQKSEELATSHFTGR
jgi:hypothetical protein